MKVMTSLFGYDHVWSHLHPLIVQPTHICITGATGCGKTTLAADFIQAYLKHNGISKTNQDDWVFNLHAGQDRGIHRIRESLIDFVRQPTQKKGVVRWVVVDDMDTFPELSQQALRRPMELYKHLTCFFFIGNQQHSLIPPLQSRCRCFSIPPLDFTTVGPMILQRAGIDTSSLTSKALAWFAVSSYGNAAEYTHHANLIAAFVKYKGYTLTDDLCIELCSIPPYMDYYPFLQAFIRKNKKEVLEHATKLWFRGFSFEDILESTEFSINFFGFPDVRDATILSRWLVLAWAAYCQGYTSYYSLCSTITHTFENLT
jgi:DNA polymerase III delta prime subunit